MVTVEFDTPGLSSNARLILMRASLTDLRTGAERPAGFHRSQKRVATQSVRCAVAERRRACRISLILQYATACSICPAWIKRPRRSSRDVGSVTAKRE